MDVVCRETCLVRLLIDGVILVNILMVYGFGEELFEIAIEEGV